jgi:hypothetical protein
VDVGGGRSRGERKDLFKVVAILCWKVRGVNIEKILCFVVVVKALEKGAAEAVNLGLSDRPRRVDTGSAAMGNGIEFMGSEFSFAGFGDGEGNVRKRSGRRKRRRAGGRGDGGSFDGEDGGSGFARVSFAGFGGFGGFGVGCVGTLSGKSSGIVRGVTSWLGSGFAVGAAG